MMDHSSSEVRGRTEFEMRRLHFREYRPGTATRKVGLLDIVMEVSPTSKEDFGDRFLGWLDLVNLTQLAKAAALDVE